ncbi:MAG: hypothetical protein WC630_03635 [Candidatus Babeliales bacterium]
MKKILLISLLCIHCMASLAAMQVVEEINNSPIESHYPPNKNGTIILNDEITLIGNCTLNHDLAFKSNGRIIITPGAHLIIQSKEKCTNKSHWFILTTIFHLNGIEPTTIAGIKQDNLIFEHQSSTIDICAHTTFSCEEETRYDIGTLHIFPNSELFMYLNMYFHDFWGLEPCWNPFRKPFKIHIDENIALIIGGVVIPKGTFDGLEGYYDR